MEIRGMDARVGSTGLILAAGNGDFGAMACMWAQRVEVDTLHLEGAIYFRFDSVGPVKNASFLWGGWDEKDLLFTLTFCKASEMPFMVEQFTIHSRFFTPPHLRPVGIKLAEASWDFLYQKFFRAVLVGRLREEKQKPKPIADPVIILELFDRLLKEEMEYMEAARKSESKV